MKSGGASFFWIFSGALIAAVISGCAGVGSPQDPSSSAGSAPVLEGQAAWYGSLTDGQFVSASPTGGSGANEVSVTIGGGEICGNYNNGGTLNQPCTSVTICTPGSTTQCQTISDILVDTGSYGLRIFASALYQNLIQGLTQVSDSSGNPVAECAQFGTGQDWGPVMIASVQLGSEPLVKIPIQVINRSFSYAPGACSQSDTGPAAAGFNGILGVGLLQNDCGAGCATQAGLGNLYFSCTGATCSGTTVSVPNQVQNPVAALSADNNGVVLSFPSLPGGMAGTVSATMYLGIGTETNNVPASGVTAYSADSSAEFDTNFNGTSYTASFIDSGSNVLFFPDSSLTTCDSNSNAPGFFCPSSTQSLTASNQSDTLFGNKTGTAGSVSFSIANASDLVQSSATAFQEIGADSSSSGFPDSFDWGLPFFFGRTVYVGIDGKTATINGSSKMGPYWAY